MLEPFYENFSLELMKRVISFDLFLKYFPKESLPITLSPDNVHYFSEKNKVLPPQLIRRFLGQNEEPVLDEAFTEYIPCFRIPDTGSIHALVYWKGSLMEYDFILCTFDKNGVQLSKKMIAGIRSDGKNVKTCIATIDEHWIIEMVAGEQSATEDVYNSANSRVFTMELMSNGQIISS